MITRFFAFLGRIFASFRDNATPTPEVSVTPQIEPKTPIVEPIPPKRDLLNEFCQAISVYEGGIGDLNHRNCNPGNVRYFNGGYASIYGVVKKDSNGFAVFKDWPTGFLYLTNMIRIRAQKNAGQTIQQFIGNYAPKGDGNNPILYAEFIGHRMGVNEDKFLMGQLLT